MLGGVDAVLLPLLTFVVGVFTALYLWLTSGDEKPELGNNGEYVAVVVDTGDESVEPGISPWSSL